MHLHNMYVCKVIQSLLYILLQRTHQGLLGQSDSSVSSEVDDIPIIGTNQ